MRVVLIIFFIVSAVRVYGRDTEPVVQTTTQLPSTNTISLQISGQAAVTTSKAPITGSFDPPSIAGPDEMVFRFDIDPIDSETSRQLAVFLVPPGGFSVDRQRFDFDSQKGLHAEAIITRNKDDVVGRIVVAKIAPANMPNSPLSTTFFSFTYVPLVDVQTYFILGAFGIVAGYVVRVAKKLLDSTEPAPHRVALAKAQVRRDASKGVTLSKESTESDVAAAAPPSKPQMLFWKYWYAVDFTTAVIVGTVLLITLMQNGRPPSTAGYAANAFAVGFAIGLLTNTELVTKVTSR